MDKNQIINEIKSYQLIEAKRMINNDGKIIYNIILGELMARKSKLDMILEEMREGFRLVNARLDKVEARLDVIELRLDKLEAEAIKHGWNLNN